MSALRTAGALVAAVSIALLLPVGPAAAKKGPGGNSEGAKVCQKDGWDDYVTSTGAAFTSADECTAYVARGGVLAPKPPPEPYASSREACESMSATFSVVDVEGFLWTCTGQEPTDEQRTLLATACYADGGDYFIVDDGQAYTACFRLG